MVRLVVILHVPNPWGGILAGAGRHAVRGLEAGSGGAVGADEGGEVARAEALVREELQQDVVARVGAEGGGEEVVGRWDGGVGAAYGDAADAAAGAGEDGERAGELD